MMRKSISASDFRGFIQKNKGSKMLPFSDPRVLNEFSPLFCPYGLTLCYIIPDFVGYVNINFNKSEVKKT